MRIVTLNIRQGGGQRVEVIATALIGHDADVLVLTEYRANDAARRLAPILAEAGYQHWADGAPERGVNSVAIASRLAFDAVTQPLVDGGNRHRVIEVAMEAFTLGAVYFPLNRVKVTFWRDEFLPLAAARMGQPYCFIGDWNTGRHHVDEHGATFFGAAEFESLTTSGWTDAWRSLHPDAREYSWYSRAGNGFRLDHAFLSPGLTPASRRAWFFQRERIDGITDHAALVVDLDLDALIA